TGVAPVVPAPPLPTPVYYTPTPLPTSAYGVWYGEYFANRSLSGAPALVRNDPAIDFYWNYTSPGPGLPVGNFSVRWAQSRYFDAGTYRFYLSSRDGIRMWVDGGSVLNEWRDGPAGPYVVDVALTSGVHLLQVAYYARSSQAYVSVSWQRLEPTPVPGYPDWKGEYFSNRDLSGSPGYVRNDTSVDFDWGTVSPAPGIPNTNYSVRWTRTIDFSSGTYRFYARSDDGIRVYVEGERIINEWHDSSGSTTYTADRSLSGHKQIVVEYYQHNGPALVKFWWERIRKTATPTKTPTPTPLPTRSPYADASPASGPVGTSVTVSIGAFPANTTVNLYLGGLVRAAEAAANTVYATTTTDRFGNGVLRFTLPATWPDGAPIKAGKLQLLAATADFSATAGATFDFTEPRPTVAPVPYAVVSPDSGGPGTQVELRGGGFPANRGLNIYLGTVVKGMTAAAALPPYVTTNSDANGNFVTTFAMPDKWPDGSTVETGKLVILVATGDFSAEASATFDYFRQAPNPAIQLSPGSGGPGTLVTVSGSGFPRNTVVNVYLATLDAQTGGGPLQSYAGGKTDGEGRFTVTFGIPATWPNGSPVSQDRLVVTAATDGFSVEVSALFVNTAPGPTWTPTPTPTPTTTPQPPTPTPTPTRMPSVQLAPQAGTAGTMVTASGSGFPANTAIYARLAVLGASSPEGPVYERYATATTDINGSYSMTFTMPATWPSGQRIATGRLVVLISTLDFAYQASATFDYTEVSAAEEEPAPVPTATDTPVPPPVEPTATQAPVEEATATWTVEPPTAPPPEEGTDAPEDGTPPP
ncbi:MAG: hypothetical protein H3C34_15160, partial [Caldilineaceae bacterium]|nr:hypothetical protein [Caldilineaceae bacterium]